MPPYGGDAPLLGGAGGASAGLGAPGGGEGGGKFSVFNLKRYRMYFNVDTQARAQPGRLCTGVSLFSLTAVTDICASSARVLALAGSSF